MIFWGVRALENIVIRDGVYSIIGLARSRRRTVREQAEVKGEIESYL
jgi:hypothetical protein